MTTFDFAPLWRSSVGFDRLFDLLEDQVQWTGDNYPPYNIERSDDYDREPGRQCRHSGQRKGARARLKNLVDRGLVRRAGEDPIPGSAIAFRLARPVSSGKRADHAA